MTTPVVVEGSSGLRLTEAAHILVLGRGRNKEANGLSPASETRARYAASIYLSGLLTDTGVVVASGYKTPGDINGAPWSSPTTGEVFQGMPEAYGMRVSLLNEGVPSEAIRTEAHSIDTVTNFARAEREGHFPDDRPVAIIAHREHLERSLTLIAPRTLRREYIGVVVPEGEVPDHDGILAAVATRAILIGLNKNSASLEIKTDHRAARLWAFVNFTKKKLGMSTEYPPPVRTSTNHN